MQSFCPNGDIKCVQFGSKVEITKIRTKTYYVRFFKNSLNKKAATPTLELDEGNVPPLLSLNMSAVTQKLSESLKKRTLFHVFSLERKTTFWAGSPFHVEM